MKKGLILGTILWGTLGAGSLYAQPEGAVYFMGAMNGRYLANQDANTYFNLDNQIGPKGYPSYSGHLGLQLGSWIAFEASAEVGPVREFEARYDQGIFGERVVRTRWETRTFSITPAVTWVGHDFVNMAGIRVGLANLAGHVTDDTSSSRGSYDQEAQTYDLGLVLRTSVIASQHFSAGLELGYDWTVFHNIANRNGQGSYDPPHSPEQNVSSSGHNGAQSSLDFSGPHVALVIGLWTGTPGGSR